MLSLPLFSGAAKHLRTLGPDGFKGRKVVWPVQHLTADDLPVVDEDGLHLSNDRALNSEVRVPPVISILGAAGPLRRYADAACEADRAVDDQQLAMGTIVHPGEAVPAQWVVPVDLDAGPPHLVDEGAVHLLAAYPVKHHVNLDAVSRPIAQRFSELAPDVA